MAVRNIYEVRQRQSVDPLMSRELDCFTDKQMAEQVIWACYREAWKTMLSSDYIPSNWFPVELRDAVVSLGFDTWSVNDYNSAAPLFYHVKHKLWNQVPSDMSNFQFTLESGTLIV
jgi:hypothetical protein